MLFDASILRPRALNCQFVQHRPPRMPLPPGLTIIAVTIPFYPKVRGARSSLLCHQRRHVEAPISHLLTSRTPRALPRYDGPSKGTGGTDEKASTWTEKLLRVAHCNVYTTCIPRLYRLAFHCVCPVDNARPSAPYTQPDRGRKNGGNQQ